MHSFYALHIYNYLLTYLRSWALLQKLPIMQPLKNFPAFYGTRRFITVFTGAVHWSLSWARSIQSIPSHPIPLRSIVHPPTSWSSYWSLSFWIPHQYPICIPLLPHSCYMSCSSHSPWLDYSNYVWWGVQVMKLLIMPAYILYCIVFLLLSFLLEHRASVKHRFTSVS
jgi:hypothetical protein